MSMPRINKILILLLLPFLALSKEFKVGVLYWSSNIEGQVSMSKGLENYAKQINKEAAKNKLPTVKLIKYVAGDGPDGVENQIDQMYRVIDKDKVDIIIVQPTDNAALVKPLKKANSKKIPVIAYDQYIMEGNLASYITSNNYQAGYLAGEYLASKFDDKKKINLILVEYPLVSSTVERVDGFFDALAANKQLYKILKTYQAVEPVSGKKAGADILKDFSEKGSIDAIFTINDGGGLEVVKAISNAGRDEILVATIDGDPASVKNIKAGKNTIIDSAQFCGDIGRQSMKVAYDKLLGKEIPKKILIPTFPITKETMKLYPGWMGRVPKSFEKPWKKGVYWNNNYKTYK
jgi:ribose transport system substrate-binding protein